MTFELVSPERKLASMQARSVRIPGMEGELTAMPQHVPMLTTLRPGYVIVEGTGETRFFVTGGFAEITPEVVAVVAEEAVEAEKVTGEWLDGKVKAAETAHEEAGEDRKIATLQTLYDYRAILEGRGAP
ncbi:MAG: ATP synthase F1 subunit epsilon [Paracoccaceae bacterium]